MNHTTTLLTRFVSWQIRANVSFSICPLWTVEKHHCCHVMLRWFCFAVWNDPNFVFFRLFTPHSCNDEALEIPWPTYNHPLSFPTILLTDKRDTQPWAKPNLLDGGNVIWNKVCFTNFVCTWSGFRKVIIMSITKLYISPPLLLCSGLSTPLPLDENKYVNWQITWQKPVRRHPSLWQPITKVFKHNEQLKEKNMPMHWAATSFNFLFIHRLRELIRPPVELLFGRHRTWQCEQNMQMLFQNQKSL